MVRPENLQCFLLLYDIVWCVTISIFHTQYSLLSVNLDDINWNIQRHSLLCFIIKALADFSSLFYFWGLKFVCVCVLYACVCTGMDIHRITEVRGGLHCPSLSPSTLPPPELEYVH